MKIKNSVLSSTAALALFILSAKVGSADTVTIKAGDTVSSIANENYTSVDTIKSANHLSNINLIFVGDKLKVNGTTDAQKATLSVAASQAPKMTSQTTTASSTATSKVPKTASQTTVTSTTANNGASSQSEVSSQMQSRTRVLAAT
ncbi:LysM peptidoglycan-binding domain-containing protein [Lactiplantibacillus plantarum]|uniref:LysM peptidoglycan-binding domain-containing protein n=1 Tax=Lactiplantibacillus plantarum TaxID=1590 RepID=UPI0021A8007D|nr:LysM domain-containing protein [Lactiplantibacillus plantarum]